MGSTVSAHSGRRLLVDSGLLTLFVVGETKRDFISSHRRTRDKFDGQAYDLLIRIIDLEGVEAINFNHEWDAAAGK